jgi:hypothetical protein
MKDRAAEHLKGGAKLMGVKEYKYKPEYNVVTMKIVHGGASFSLIYPCPKETERGTTFYNL